MCLVADLLGVHAWRLLHRTQHESTPKCPHPYSLFHIYTRSDLHDPLLQYPPLLPQKARRPKQHRRHKSGLELANVKKRRHARHAVWTGTSQTTRCGIPRHETTRIVLGIDAHTCVYTCFEITVLGPLREWRSIQSGASGLPHYCAPLVFVSEVIESLAVCLHNKPKIKNQKCS